MSSRFELKEILNDLKTYFEFQKAMGVEAVFAPKTEKKKQLDTRTSHTPSTGTEKKMADSEEDKDVIRVEEQLDIFESKKLTLEQIREELGDCKRCKLHKNRKNIVFGEGNPDADIMFVGEGPGRDEDEQGRPFVGRAGQLLDKIIAAMGLERKDVYIANIVKSRPPKNRTPEQDEIAACIPFLYKQIRAIDPKVIVCLGATAAYSLLQTKGTLKSLRNRFHYYGNIKVMVTYHPAALLRTAKYKRPLWEDIQVVMEELGLERPDSSGD